jgi:hypothetical protein
LIKIIKSERKKVKTTSCLLGTAKTQQNKPHELS